MQDRYYSLAEVARVLNVSYMTIYRWVHDRKLKATQVGRQFRISSQDLNEFIAAGEKIQLQSVSKSLSKFIGSGMMDYAYIESHSYDVDLSLGVNPLGCSERVTEHYQQKDIRFSNYSEVTSRALQKKIGEVYGFSPEEVVIGSGVSDLLHLCYATFIDPGDEVLIPELTFPSFEFLAILTHAEPIFIPSSKDFDLDYVAIPQLIGEKSKLVVLCNPNNPTGRQLQLSSVERLLLANPKLIFVIDEANIDFGGVSALPLVKKHPNLIVLRSFSKGFGLAGLRVGFAVGAKSLMYAIRRRQTPFSVNVFAQKLAEVALSDMDFIEKTRNYIIGERQYLERELDRLGLPYERSDSNYVLVNISSAFLNAKSCIKTLNALNANAVSGDDFNGLGGKYIRLAPRMHEMNERFVEILEKLVK